MIKTQSELLKTEEQEIKRLDKEVKVVKGIAWSQLGMILLLVFL